MRKTCIVLAGLMMGTMAVAQGGQGGGFGGGGFGGGGVQGVGGFGGGGFGGNSAGAFGRAGNQGQQQQQYDQSVQNIQSTISRYVNTVEIKNILTPGEYSEWPLTLKAGQVVIAEARSEAFDPALEVTDPAGKVLASNDDRYPGDQRPLLLWRCETAGKYSLRGRCFRDKAGGQFFLKFNIYDSVDATSEKLTDHTFDQMGPVLFRIPMKAGEIRRLVSNSAPQNNLFVLPQVVIGPTGLPDIHLGYPLASLFPAAIVAPVAGDYYYLAELSGQPKSTLHVGSQGIATKPLSRDAAGTGNGAGLWSLQVKKGEFLEVSTPNIASAYPIVVAELPDVSKYDLAKPDSNPFFPKPGDQLPPTDAFTTLPARTRDLSVTVFVAQRDTTLWIASPGPSKGGAYTVKVQLADRALSATEEFKSHLKVGKYDYWTFDAKVGDVMTFASTASGFSESITVRDPSMQVFWEGAGALEESKIAGTMIVSRPGRYIAAVSCFGDGGSGDYSLTRRVVAPRTFAKGTPATDTIDNGQVQAWKFTAKPGEPLLVHWKSSTYSYSISIQDEQGGYAQLPLRSVDANNQYGILTVDKPTTLLIVLIGNTKAQYTIELSDLPGLKGKG